MGANILTAAIRNTEVLPVQASLDLLDFCERRQMSCRHDILSCKYRTVCIGTAYHRSSKGN